MNKTRSIAYCGLITALHVIATILLRFEWVPGIELAILFIVPFFSATISLKTDIKYSLIFALASLLICALIEPTYTLMYILPTISVGLVYGFCVKKNVDGTSIVYLLTIIEYGLFFLSAYIIKTLTEVDIIETMEKILHFQGANKSLGLGFLLIYSFAQAFLVHIVTKSELKKIKIEVKKTIKPSFFNIIIGLAGFIASFFTYKDESIVFFMSLLGIISIVPIALYGYQATDKPYIILAVQAFVFLAGTLPLLKLLENLTLSYKNIDAYLLLVIPPVGYALYDLFIKREKVSK